MSLIFNEYIKREAKELIKGGTINAIALFDTETGEIQKLASNEQEAGLYCMQNNPKDETKYSSSIVRLIDIVEGRCIV